MGLATIDLDNNRRLLPNDAQSRPKRCHATAGIQPEVGDCDESVGRKHEGKRIAQPRQNAVRLAKVLHALSSDLRRGFESLAAHACTHGHGAGQTLCVDAAALRDPT